MVNIWKDYPQKPLPDLLEFIVDNRGKTVPTVSQEEACEIVLIATNCIRNENLYPVYEKVRYISRDTYENWFRAHPQSGDIIFVNKGTPGRVCFCPEHIDFCIAQDMMAFRADSSQLYNKYLLALLRSRELQEQIRITSVGDTIPHFKKEFLKELAIPLPPLSIQHIIGDYYFTLSEKIELNNRINANLEQQAQTIYQEYIVSASNYSKNGIIGDYCSVKSGYAFKSNWWLDDGIRVIKIKSIENKKINLQECSYVSEDKLQLAEEFSVIGGDLLIAMTGATIGKFAIVPQVDEPLLVNQRVGKFFLGNNPIKKLPFIYCTLNNQDIINEIINKGQGSAQPNISGSDILSTPCYYPDNSVITEFNKTCSPLFETIITNQRENLNLAALRDALLPKLMSGEINV